MTTDKAGTVRRTSAGAAMFDLLVEVPRVFFRLRALGRSAGAVTPWGAGSWGLLRSLKLAGPQTVPELARARPVARQRIQKLANELADAGLVEFIDNPAHRRSKLLRLTAAGDAHYRRLTSALMAEAERLAAGLNAEEIARAESVIAAVRQRLESDKRAT